MTVIFQSHLQLDFCDRILQSLEEDDGESLLVATSSPEVSLASLKLLQLFSPLVREIVKTLPSLPSAASPLTLILPDTDANTWKCLMGLLTNGNVDVRLPSCETDVERQKEKISDLARCLRINLESRQVSEKARIKLRVKRPEELLKERSNSPIASNQENNMVSNDYDSDQEEVPVSSLSDLSALNYCESSTGASSTSSYNIAANELESEENHGVKRLIESQKDASYFPPPEEVLIENLDLIKKPVLEVKRKVILTWKKNATTPGKKGNIETFSDSINCKNKFPEGVKMPNSQSGLDDHSNPNKEGAINYPSKDVKLTYAAWKARRAELKLMQQNAEKGGNEAEIKNNVVNPNPRCEMKFISPEKCPRCSKVFKTKESLFYHFKATHRENEMPFECVECPDIGLGFVKKTALSNHLSRSHALRIKRDSYIINSESAMYKYETERFPSVGANCLK